MCKMADYYCDINNYWCSVGDYQREDLELFIEQNAFCDTCVNCIEDGLDDVEWFVCRKTGEKIDNPEESGLGWGCWDGDPDDVKERVPWVEPF